MIIINKRIKSFASFLLKRAILIQTARPPTFCNSYIARSRFSFASIPTNRKYHQEELPIKVQQILFLLENQSVMNEKTVILQYLVDTIKADAKIILTRDQRMRIVNQLKKWSGRKGRFDKIATIAWTIKQLSLEKELKELYLEIAQRFENDQWYANFDQALKALEAFSDLQNEEIKRYIYPRIERNLEITVWEFNMKVYKRMVVGILQSGRVESPLWDKLEDYILRNLGMEYSLKTITDIFSCYAIAQRGSDIFFQMIQKAICLGHWFDYEYKHRLLPGYDQNGQFYALLVETYSKVKANCNIVLLPEFLDYIYNGVADRKTNYHHLSSFARIIQHLPQILDKQDQEQIIKNLLENKKPTSLTYQQLVCFYQLVQSRNINVSPNFCQHIEHLFLSDVKRRLIPASKIIQMTEELLASESFTAKKELLQSVEDIITKDFKYLEGEEASTVLRLCSQSTLLPLEIKQHALLLPLHRSGKRILQKQ